MSPTGHKYEMTPFLIGKRAWDKLSDGDKKIVQEAANEATALQRKLAQEADDKMFVELKAKGVQIDKVDQAPFEKATAPVLAKWEASPIGPFVKKVVAAARAK
jgi:TRAP-type C4-dicarboxylate transport system substrate-binding protein